MSDFLLSGSQPTPPKLSGITGAHNVIGAEQPEADEPITLRGVVGVLRRKIWLIMGITVVATVVTGVIAYRMKPVYRASAVIRIDNAAQQMTAGIDNSVLDNAIGPTMDPVLSQIQVLLSRDVAGQVIDQHPAGLQVIPVGFRASELSGVTVDSSVVGDTLELEFADSGFTVRGRAGPFTAGYGVPVALDGIGFTLARMPSRTVGQLMVTSREVAINTLIQDLDAQARKSTNVIDVSYKNSDPVITQAVVDTLVTVFQRVNAVTAQDESRRRRVFVQEQLAETDSILTQAQLALSDFASSKQMYGAEQQIAAEQAGIMDLDVTRSMLNADRSMYRGFLDSLDKAGGQRLSGKLDEVMSATGVGGLQASAGVSAGDVTGKLNTAVSSAGIAQNPVVQVLYQQLVGYETTRDSLTTGPWASARTNPDVTRLNALIATTQQRLVGATRSQVDALSARITALDALKATAATQLQKLPAMGAAEARLVQRVDAARNVSDQLREEYQKARISEAVGAGQVGIIDLAPFPMFPISRSPLLKTILGLVVGLMLGMGAGFLRESLDTAIQGREDVESVLHVPGLAIIPQILPANRRFGRLRLGGASREISSGNKAGVRNNNVDPGLIAATDGRSHGAEAFRTLRTSLIFTQAVQSLRTIVVTSSEPGEGKTTTISNLAVTFAQQGMRVILVDCDLRRARLHTVFGVPRDPGLTNAMLGQGPIEQFIRPTAVDGLFFLSAGALPPNPAELLGGPHMAEVLASLRSSYDIILMDTPPIHAAADPLILGRQADGVVLIVRAGKTDKNAAQDAMRSLASVGARVVGAVLNDPDHKVQAHGGYYYYDYYASNQAETEPAGT